MFPQSDLLNHYMTVHMQNARPLQTDFRCKLPDCGRIFAARHYLRMHLERGHVLGPEDVSALLSEKKLQKQLNENDMEEQAYEDSETPVLCVPATPSSEPLPQQDYYQRAPLNEAYDLPPPPEYISQKIICPLCGTGFLTQKNLQRHLDSTHPTPSQILNYTSSDTWCRECCKSFSSKYNLDRHLEVHRGVKYPCNVCGKVYTQKYAWSQHMKASHGQNHEEDNLW